MDGNPQLQVVLRSIVAGLYHDWFIPFRTRSAIQICYLGKLAIVCLRGSRLKHATFEDGTPSPTMNQGRCPHTRLRHIVTSNLQSARLQNLFTVFEQVSDLARSGSGCRALRICWRNSRRSADTMKNARRRRRFGSLHRDPSNTRRKQSLDFCCPERPRGKKNGLSEDKKQEEVYNIQKTKTKKKKTTRAPEKNHIRR